jgi:hexokinase
MVERQTMRDLKTTAREFLERHGMHPAAIDLKAGVADFLREMEEGLNGRRGGLEMIPTYLEVSEELPLNQPVIAIDAGGSNVRVASVSFDEDLRPAIRDFQNFTMPGVEREVGKREFFHTMAGYLEQVISSSRRIGFSFSYSIDQLPSRDARVRRFGKEIKAPELIGELVGDGLLQALRERGHGGERSLVVLNDTVATMQAGKAGSAERSYSGYIGFILGTGFNTCYSELNRNIGKLSEPRSEGSQVINMESGNYSRPPQGTMDQDLARETRFPREAMLEKMISGAYLGSVVLYTLRRAAAEGLFSPPVGGKLLALAALSTDGLHAFLDRPTRNDHPLGAIAAGAGERERELLYYLSDMIVERAAKLSALVLSATLLKAGAGEDPCRPVCIVAEGSVFWGMHSMKSKVQYYLKSYLEEQEDRHFRIIRVENASLVGAAIAGLTN